MTSTTVNDLFAFYLLTTGATDPDPHLARSKITGIRIRLDPKSIDPTGSYLASGS